MNENRSTLPSQADFMAAHLHSCGVPAEEGSRCSICLSEWSESSGSIVRIDLNHTQPCFYHKKCIVAWFNSVGQPRWCCPAHRIDLFDPTPVAVEEPERSDVDFIEDPDLRAVYQSLVEEDEEDAYPFMEASPRFLYIYARDRVNTLETRARRNANDTVERIMWRHSLQRTHDLNLAQAMFAQPHQSNGFYSLARRIKQLTEEFDVLFLRYMRQWIMDTLNVMNHTMNRDERLRYRLPNGWWDMFLALRGHAQDFSDFSEDDSLFLATIYFNIVELRRVFRRYRNPSFQPQETPGVNGPDRYGRMLAQYNHERPLATVNASSYIMRNIMIDGTRQSLASIFSSVRHRVRDHRMLDANVRPRANFVLTIPDVTPPTERARDLELSAILDGYQHIYPEFRPWARLLRHYVRVADERYMNHMSADIRQVLDYHRPYTERGWLCINAEQEAQRLDLEDALQSVSGTTSPNFDYIEELREATIDYYSGVSVFLGRDPSGYSARQAVVEQASIIRAAEDYVPYIGLVERSG